ncbi:MAG: hypothetical protein KDN22_30065 [Verrucomicrobiae bacterium]|nr:hypothetical protein [Verrucomicrobiae bacterium]
MKPSRRSFISSALLCLAVVVSSSATVIAQQSQNPSPMVEHTRAHPRLDKEEPTGTRIPIEDGTVLFLPEALLKSSEPTRLFVHFHGGHWIPQLAAAKATGFACLSIQVGSGSGAYARRFAANGSFVTLVAEAEKAANRKFGPITVSGWSAGCGAIREILHDEANDALLEYVILLDGIHTSYTDGTPGPLESKIETAKLAPFVRFARRAIAGHARMLITHTTIFPGTFASTTETADWLLRELEVSREAVLRWGPMKTQQLSEAMAGSFVLQGFAGNSAPDHVDLLHALPEFLKRAAK